jgi:hypothetical protein
LERKIKIELKKKEMVLGKQRENGEDGGSNNERRLT